MKLNIPNKLTLFRICVVPVILLFIMVPVINDTWSRAIACAVFVLGAVSDFLDGFLARKMNKVTSFGKFLDPIADKFLIIGSLTAICASSSYRNVFWFVFIGDMIVVLRELAVTSLRLLAAASGDHTVIAAGWLGKIKTVLQCVSVIILIIEPLLIPAESPLGSFRLFSFISVILMAAMTVWSGIDYFIKYKSVIFENASI